MYNNNQQKSYLDNFNIFKNNFRNQIHSQFIHVSIVLRIFCMIISHAARSGDNTCKQCKYREISIIPEFAVEILKSILIAQQFLHPNALYVFDKTFTLFFLSEWEKALDNGK